MRHSILLYGVTLFLASGVFSGHVQAQSLTLQDALNIALRNNLGVEIARNGVDTAAIYNSYGFAGGLPYVGLSGSDVAQTLNIAQKYSTPANDVSRNGATSNTFSGGLYASVLLYNGQRVLMTKRQLNMEEAQSKEILNSRILGLVYNVMLKYYDVIRQQSYAKTLEKSIDVSRERLDIVKVEMNAGMANNADLFQSQVDLNTQLQNLKAQQLVIDQDKTDLLTLLTLRPDSAISVQDTIIVDRSIRLDSILSGVTNNPDITAANDQISINQYVEKETAALRYPSLTFNTGYAVSRTDNSSGFNLLTQNYGPQIGVGLSIPLFNGSIYKRQQQIAGINTRTARMMRDTLMLNYTASAVKNWQAYSSNLDQLRMAQENYALSQQLLDLVIQRFQLRQATIVDVKNAQDSFENAGYMLVNLAYAAKSAEIILKRYANQLRF